jgi:peptidoglycan/LPS O-acetylase OafA/YrhL
VAALSILLFASLAAGIAAHLGRFLETAAIAFFAVLIFFLAFDRGLVASALSLGAVAALGEASYPLYILQAPVWGYLELLYTKLLHAGPALSIPFYCLLLTVLCMIALLANRYVEIPANKRIRAFFARKNS